MLAIGIVMLLIGIGITSAMRGQRIFIGLMVVGALWILRGIYYLLKATVTTG